MNARRPLKALWLPLQMIAGWMLSLASARTLRFGAQTSRSGDALNGAGFAVLLLLGAVLLSSAPALAQPIVSNLEESAAVGLSANDFIAASFTTGSRGGGYTLTEAVIPFLRGSSSVQVHIYNAAGSLPGASIGMLDGLTLISAAGNYTFTSAAGISLAASTTYYLAFKALGGGFGTTTSANQTTTDGWDIGNGTFLTTSGGWAGPLRSILRFSLSARQVLLSEAVRMRLRVFLEGPLE